MAYQPIENYGLIGNLHTAALVGMDGSIDWMRIPRFDSASVFAAILDDQKGGRFQSAAPASSWRQVLWEQAVRPRPDSGRHSADAGGRLGPDTFDHPDPSQPMGK
jgi:GH15 family glucan-1,4-alpha-glucosidase